MQQHLPKRPNIDYLRKRAKRLLRRHKSGDAETAAVVRRHVDSTDLTLRQAQLVVAREYGFSTWADLAVFVRYRREVGQVANRINWFWIPALDLDRAAAFYRNVLACEVWIHREDGFAIFEWEKGEASGGLDTNIGAPSKDGIRVLLNCEGRLDAAVAAARGNGGKVVAVCTLGEFGLQAIVEDTEGNQVHLHSFTKDGAELAAKEYAATVLRSAT